MKEQTVRLVATKKEYEIAPYFIAPKFDEKKKVYLTGQENLNKEQLAEEPLVITEETSIPFRHGQEFSPGVRADAILLKLAQLSDVVAPNKKQVIPSQHRFYIENKEEEAVEKISIYAKRMKSYEIITGMSMEEMSDFARLLGINARFMTKKQVEASLFEISEQNPDRILLIHADGNRKHKIFLNKLVDSEVLKVKNGKYYHNEELIGASQDFAIEFLKDKTNADLISQWAIVVGEDWAQKATLSKKTKQNN